MADLPVPIQYLPSRLPGLSFELHPASVEPPENIVGFIRDRDGNQRAAIYRDGVWRKADGSPINREVMVWGMLDRRMRNERADQQS